MPFPEYREALLGPSFPFSRVPTAYRADGWVPLDGWREGAPGTITLDTGELPTVYTVALVLAWAGAPVAEGMSRAREVLARIEGLDPQHGVIFTSQSGEASLTTSDGVRDYPDAATRDALAHAPDEAEALARILEARGAGTCVIVSGGEK